MSGTTSIGSLGSSVDALASQYKTLLQTQSLSSLQSKQSSLNAQISALATMKSKLKSLYDTTSSMVLSQTARSDRVHSSLFNDATKTIVASELTAAEKIAGTATRQFKVTVGTAESTIDVSLGSDDTNNTVLTSIGNAINANIGANPYVTASVQVAATGQSVLLLTSKISGSQGVIALQDVGPGTLMSSVGIGSSVVSGRQAPSLSGVADDPTHASGGYDYAGSTTVLDASASSVYASVSAVSSDASVAVSAGAGALVGAHTVRVTQLAKNDSIVTKQFTGSATTISSALSGEGYGTKTFAVTVGSGAAVPVSVSVSEGDTNTTVLNKVAAAINSVQAIGINASVVNDDSTHARLVFTSKSTGSASAVTAIADSTGTLSSVLGLAGMTFTPAARTASSTNQTGFLQVDSAALDSKFTLDGIAITKSSNSVNDALTGVTLSLQALSTADVSVTLSINNTQIKSNIQTFLNTYNSALTYIKTQTAVDTTTFARQIFAGDSTFVSLRSSLQTTVLRQVSGLGSDPSLLSAIGITADKQGMLSITDSAKFNDAMNGSTLQLAQVFNSPDGIAVRLKNYLASFVTAGGRVDASTENMNKALTTLKSQITRTSSRIDKQVQRYRDQFTALQGVLQQVTSQQQIIQQLYTSLGLV